MIKIFYKIRIAIHYFILYRKIPKIKITNRKYIIYINDKPIWYQGFDKMSFECLELSTDYYRKQKLKKII